MRSSTGCRPPNCAVPLLLLAAVAVGRAVVAWLTERAAHRASAAVKSELRGRLLERAAALGPGWLSGQRTGSLVTLATRGVDALDDYFSRYLPQLGLAVVVPVAVLARIVTEDWVSAAIIVGTLPLIPIFMVLIGWATQSRMDRQWRSLSRLSGHFLDVVAGLPTLKVFGRAKAQAASIRRITGEYRQATLRTLRIAFLSSFALELLATLSVALVAVTIGMRLVHGEMDLYIGLVILVLAPEAYLPLRQVGAQYHAAAEGLAAAGGDLRRAGDAGAGVGYRCGACRGRGLRRGHRAVSGAFFGCGDRGVVHRGTRGDRGAGRAQRGGQVDAAECAAGVRTAHRGGGCGSGVPISRGSTWRSGGRGSHGCRRGRICTPGPSRRTYGWPGPRPTTTRCGGHCGTRGRGSSWSALPEGVDTVLGEDGAGLSAGQRQRLALARAFLADRPVLLLDEPTAALDGATEGDVVAAVRRLAVGRTVLLVVHRPALLGVADRVVRLGEPSWRGLAGAGPRWCPARCPVGLSGGSAPWTPALAHPPPPTRWAGR